MLSKHKTGKWLTSIVKHRIGEYNSLWFFNNKDHSAQYSPNEDKAAQWQTYCGLSG